MVSENNFAKEEIKEGYAQEGDYQEMNQPPNRPMPEGYYQQPYSGPGTRNPQGYNAYRQPTGYKGNYPRNYQRIAGNYPLNYTGYQGNYPGYNYRDHDYEDNYHHEYHHDFHDDYENYQRGYYGRTGMMPGYGPGPYGGMMSGYGPGVYDGMAPGRPMGFLRNWFYPGFFTNWFRSPRANSFFRGVGMVTVGVLLAPPVARAIRPLAVQAVQGVKGVVDEIRGVVADAREEVEDIFAETNWDSRNMGEGPDRGKGLNGEC